MAQAISAVLAFAAGIGVSPIPIIVGIMMLFSARAKVNGPVFLVAWMIGLTVVLGVVIVLAETAGVGTDSTADDSQSWIKVGFGVLLLAGAARRWRQRPGPDDEPEMPAWTKKIDQMRPSRAFGLGLALSANPKNLMLAFGAGTSLVALDPDDAELVAAVVAFVLVGSAFLIGAVGYALAGGSSARNKLDEAKVWLTFHNTAVMTALFIVFGVVLIANGLGRS